METLVFILACLAVAGVGAWEVSKHKAHRIGKLPEDIQ